MTEQNWKLLYQSCLVDAICALAQANGSSTTDTVNPADPTHREIVNSLCGMYRDWVAEDDTTEEAEPEPACVEIEVTFIYGTQIDITAPGLHVSAYWDSDANADGWSWVKGYTVDQFNELLADLIRHGDWTVQDKDHWPPEYFEDPMGCPSMYM